MNRRRRGQCLTPQEPPLADFRADPKLEVKLGWIEEIVVCRECGQKLASIATKHLRSHELTQKTYHDNDHWPEAPMLSQQTRAATNTAALKFAKKDPEKHRQGTEKWRKDPKNKPKLKAQGKRATARRRADPEP